ncbi:YqzL family protein [Ammoniphilus resinae]|uniref:YqzL family protein n=1 Tax=Ammoniphilus resinae TaxID=861532 RepID=A0ABS4GJV4_9BACL|nr:YqzL family protein [Ammoniphilus resinae]MBP1930536.1 hypothetical protein [Ammoniphilus resinae]
MQNLSWTFFSATGNIDAYLLYKDFERMTNRVDEPELSIESEESEG